MARNEIESPLSRSLQKATDAVVARIFRLVCVDRLARSPEEDMHDFDRDYGHTERLFRRLGGRVTLRAKNVLDVGCGTGPTCVYAALHGARRVVGVDIIEEHLAFARSKLARDYPHLVGAIEYLETSGGLRELETEKFDVIISQNAFEHYSNPEGIVTRLETLLSEDGVLVIAFGPLWKSPYGGHIGFMTRFPWAHLIFPEHIVMSERRRLIPAEDARRYEDAIGGLNRMTLQRFRGIMRASNLECVHFDANVSEKRVMRLVRLVARVPFLEEFFTQNVYSIWRLRTGSVG